MTKFNKVSILVVAAALAAASISSCVAVDSAVGEGFNQIEQLFDVYRAEVELKDIALKQTDSLSGYSTRRVTVGSLRDEKYGLTDKCSAFTLVPADDTLDFGTNTRYINFHVSMTKDTVSCSDNSQSDIIQTLRIYALEDAGVTLDSNVVYTGDLKKSTFSGLKQVGRGYTVYDGGDSLSFDLTQEYGTKLLQRLVDNSTDGVMTIDTIPDFTNLFPGLFISCDEPIGYGGRINMFLTKLSYDSDQYIDANYATLKFKADYGERKDVDTSFLFLIGATDFAESLSDMPDQYVFNSTEHENLAEELSKDGEHLYIEGGCGIKPVISSKEIREAILADMAKNGITDPTKAIINKATLVLPFEEPENYLDFDKYPQKLCPTCRIRGTLTSTGEKYITYANITDASISAEDQGEINRSTCRYTPDISYHAQKIITLKDPTEKDFEKYNLWFLITYEEEEKVENTTTDESSSYLSQLAYYSYLNSMYGGGYGYGSYYGGYSSYGGYGSYGYSNYYSMLAYYSMMSSYSSSSTTEYTEELDRDRFYDARLNGPANSGEKPRIIVTYSVPKTLEN